MTSHLIPLVCALALPGLAQPPQPGTSRPTFQAGADMVTLDLIVRDKKGRPVRDLARGDIEVYDNGVKVNFRDLHLVADSGDAVVVGKTSTATSRPSLDPTRQLRLVTLVFERLGAEGRIFARKAALDILKTRERPNVYYAVFVIDQHLKLIQQYTNGREALARAIERATGGAYAEFTSDSDHQQDQLQKVLERLGGAPSGRSLEEMLLDLKTQAGNKPPRTEVMFAEAQLEMLQYSQQLGRDQMGRASVFSLLSLIRGQASLPGRKSVLYFTEGLYVPGSMSDLFQLLIGEANRSNVTFYAADVRGLKTTSENDGIAALRGALASSSARVKLQDPGSAAVTHDEITAQDRGAESIRMNGENAMAELAEDTGGFLIANTNDYRGPLRRVDEEIGAYYELSYQPGKIEYDGKFRRIEVRALRAGLTIQSRSGYFALPPAEGFHTAVVQPFEVPLLKALSSGTPPHDLEFRAQAMLLRATAGAGTESLVVVELPLGAIQFQPDDLNGVYRGQIGVLPLVGNEKREVVQKMARDLPFQAPPERILAMRAGNFIFKDQFKAPPGKYWVEVAVMDRKAERAGAQKFEWMAPSTTERLSASALMHVRSYLPNAPDLDAADPFAYQGGRITPTLEGTVHLGQDAAVGLFCVVSSDPQNGEMPTLILEFVRGNATVRRRQFALAPPNSQGMIPWASFTPVAELEPGSYEARVTVKQGDQEATSHVPLTLEP